MQIIKQKESWSYFTLRNGDKVKIKPIVLSIKKNKTGGYDIRTQIVSWSESCK